MLEKFSEKMEAIDTRWLPYRRFAGLALSVFVLLTLLGCVSYLFTWTLDQSVLPGLSIFDRKLDVAERSDSRWLIFSSAGGSAWQPSPSCSP